MKSKIVFFIVSFIMWFLLSWDISVSNIFVGLLVCFILTWIMGGMFTKEPEKYAQFTRYIWFLYYLPVFFWEMLKANLDVAYRVIHPDMPINPGIVKVRTKLKSEAGLTILANSITLTPGTITVDCDPENGYLYVHCINVKSQDIDEATKIIVEKFEKILVHIFE